MLSTNFVFYLILSSIYSTFKLNINKNSESIIINKDYLQQNKNEENSIKIYFYIRRSKTAIINNQECKYTITQKSSNLKGVLLQPGLIKTSKILKGQKAQHKKITNMLIILIT